MTSHDEPDEYSRPDGVTDGVVAALGKFNESMEMIERARGALFEFHQLVGYADEMLDEVADRLDDEGHGELGELIRRDLIGRNIIDGRWTFQIVDEFHDTYYDMFRHVDATVRERLVGGRRHLAESEMKDRRITKGHPKHERRPSLG